MTIHALVTGMLGVQDGNTLHFVRFVAFSEPIQAELLRLDDGDAVSIQGPLKAEIYTSTDNTPKLSLSIVADNILPLRPPPKVSNPKAAMPPGTRSKIERQRGTWRDEFDGPNDSINDLSF